MKSVFLAGAAGLAISVAPATAQLSTAAAAKAFGARQYVEDISLAPDGSKVAMVVPLPGRGEALQIADFTSGKPPKTILSSSGNPDRLRGCSWVSSSRLVCRISFIDTKSAFNLGFSRLIAVNADGTELKMVSDRTTERSEGVSQYGGSIIDWTGDGKGTGSVMMMRYAVPENTIGTKLASTKEGMAVDLVDTRTLSHRIVESPKLAVSDYMTDGLGTIRILATRTSGSGGYMGDLVTWTYRRAGQTGFETLGTMTTVGQTVRGLEVVAVDPKLDAAYAFDDQDGRRVLVRIALDGSKRRETVLSKPGVDVDEVLKIGRQQRVVGASWAGETRQVELFDPELKAFRASLGRAIPNQPLVNFVDATTDEKQLLLFAGSDKDPGTYYLFDKASKKLEEVMPVRPQLAKVALAEMKPITFAAADGTQIPGYLTLPPGSSGKGLPAIVMPHGGPAARDEWNFDWLAQFFANRGFAVLQPNFRGSAGYGEKWFEKNGFQSWRIAIGDVNAGGKWLVSQGIADPAKMAIVGWSYGGYAALQSAALDPDLFKAIVAIAPVTDLEMWRNQFRQFTNFPIVDRFVGSGPHVREGSPTSNAAKIKAPVLMFHGDLDLNVKVNESRAMEDKLRGAGKKVELVEFKGLDHQLDDGTARAQMLEKSDAFLRASLGM